MEEIASEARRERLRQEVMAYSKTSIVSSSQQTGRDRCLRVYSQFVEEMYPEVSNDKAARNSQMFPEDEDDQVMILLMFLISISETTEGKGKGKGKGKNNGTNKRDPITVGTLVSYESHMVHWITTERHERRLRPIDRGELSMRFRRVATGLHRDDRLSTFGKETESLAGPNEVRKLIDYDLRQTPDLKLAKGHHLAWCIGVQTGVRADSLGPDSGLHYRDEDLIHLAWKDVVIERLSEDRLIAKMTFRKLKTNDADVVTFVSKGKDASIGKKQLTTPRDVNSLVLSVPHRLVIIAIRGGILEGIETIQDFFADNRQRLRIKDAYLEDPIIYAASERGLRMIPQPATSSSLSTYLNNKGERIGFSESCTFYSFRRWTASITETRVDLEAAREMLDHKSAKTTRKHYVKTRDWVDSTAITLNENISGPNGKSQELVDRANTLLSTSLTPEALKSIDSGNFAREATSQLEASGDPFDKNAIRRLTSALRQKAVQELVSQESRVRTIEEYEQRLLDFSKCLFTEKIQEIASRDDTSMIQALMTVLWDNPLSEYRNWMANPPSCPICEEDDTIDDDIKARTYDCPQKLYYHKNTYLHTPLAKWKRLVEQEQQHSDTNTWACPFCRESCVGSAVRTYSTLKNLVRHIDNSNAKTTNAKHDLLKTRAGWYEAGFREFQDEEYQQARTYEVDYRKRKAEKTGNGTAISVKRLRNQSEPVSINREVEKPVAPESMSSNSAPSELNTKNSTLKEVFPRKLVSREGTNQTSITSFFAPKTALGERPISRDNGDNEQ